MKIKNIAGKKTIAMYLVRKQRPMKKPAKIINLYFSSEADLYKKKTEIRKRGKNKFSDMAKKPYAKKPAIVETIIEINRDFLTFINSLEIKKVGKITSDVTNALIIRTQLKTAIISLKINEGEIIIEYKGGYL